MRIFTSNESYAKLIWIEMNQQQVNQFKLEIFVSFLFFFVCTCIYLVFACFRWVCWCAFHSPSICTNVVCK